MTIYSNILKMATISYIIDYKHILYINLYINYNLEDIEHIDGLSKYIEYKEKEFQDEKY